ncbi:hypothetical protein DPEC_G00308700 [Dallia pectoralis]|uniref:Uncharacterized protein n=1 Tax=Dallia pectoralis TaxID=75939 RepID=A0ACC2FEP4_DALPE|nr:hypothetical protein DPEC_G00308700 [Dallia pectoralis]
MYKCQPLTEQGKCPEESYRSWEGNLQTELNMEKPVKLVFVVLIIAILVADNPTDAWYKQVAGPSYYSVGRASGLLSGIRRSPYVRRSEIEAVPDSGESTMNGVFTETGKLHNAVLRSMPICIRDMLPDLQSCQPVVHDGASVFQCKADVFVSLNSLDCEGA